MRKAANYATDRPALLRTFGANAGVLTDQILPPGHGRLQERGRLPAAGAGRREGEGARRRQVRHRQALELEQPDRLRTRRRSSKANLEKMGCTVDVKLFQGYQIFTVAGKKGAEYDAAILGWSQDYPDPYDFVDVLLNGKNIHDENNNNLAYLNDKELNAKLDAANKLTGDARYNAYGNLDIADHAGSRAVGLG